MTIFRWRFIDWAYQIDYCTPNDYSQKINSTPPAERDRIWDVAIADDIRMKCNGAEVLHLEFNEAADADCTSKVKWEGSKKNSFLE